MSEKELKSKIFSEDFDPKKALEEWAERVKECEETTGHEYIFRIINLYSNIQRPIMRGKCNSCGYLLVRELTQEEKRGVYEARESSKKAQDRHMMK